MNYPIVAYGCPMPGDTYPRPAPAPFIPWPWPAPPQPQPMPPDVSVVINNGGPRTDAEHDLDELIDAVEKLPPPVTEAGMRLVATVAKLRERQRQRLGLPLPGGAL